jgi:hypothetical protein
MECQMELSLEKCPLCGTELSGIKFKEIQAKLRREEQEQAAQLSKAESTFRMRLEQQFNQDLEKQRLALEKKAKDEAEVQTNKVAAELDLAAKKLKEAEARGIEIQQKAQQELAREKAAVQAQAKKEAEKQIQQAAVERDELAKKLKEAQQREAETKKAADQEIEKQKLAAEKTAKADAAKEINKLVIERDQAAVKAKEAEALVAESRKQAEQEIEKQKLAAEKKAKAEAADQINKLVIERDQAAAKTKEAEAREAVIRSKVTKDAEETRLRDLAQQRQALENDKREALLKQQCESNRRIESIQKKMQQVEKQLQNKTANELGDGAEIDLFEGLREHFPTDKISRVAKGSAGADILIEVLYKGTSCGRVIVESKNRNDWKFEYVTKLRLDQVEASAEHAILATTFFPAGKKEMCIESDVIVISPARVVYVMQLLRNAMVTMHIKGLSMKERSAKMAKLYKLITSEAYSRKFAEAGRLTEEILEVDVQEKKTHDNVWKKRGSLTKQVQNVLREVETEVAAVIESADDLEVPPSFGVKSAHGSPVASRTREIG